MSVMMICAHLGEPGYCAGLSPVRDCLYSGYCSGAMGSGMPGPGAAPGSHAGSRGNDRGGADTRARG